MERKNVVFIICDQLRKDCLGTYGHPYVKTPHIDALAEEGTKFERCYVNNPVCMPNRMSIFTGMYPRNHGLWANGVMLEDTGKTFMHHLLGQGYQTANVGKIHFEPTQDRSGQVSREARCLWENKDHTLEENYWGYEYKQMTIGHGVPVGDYLRWFYAQGGVDEQRGIEYIAPHTGISKLPKALHYSTFISETSCEYIKERRDKERPFFLTVSFPDPHSPFAAPKDVVKEREIKEPIGDEKDLQTRPENYQRHYEQYSSVDSISKEELKEKRISYTYDLIELVDENVGKIIQTLKNEGIYEDTLIVFVADHGEMLGDHGLWLKGDVLYEGLVNVPLILVDHKHKGEVSTELVSTIDIVPTLCEQLGVEVPYYVDGKNIFDEEHKREACLVEYRPKINKSMYALVTKRYKYIRYANGVQELTDLEKDPQERENKIESSEYSEVVTRLKEQLLDYLIQTPSRTTQKMFPH